MNLDGTFLRSHLAARLISQLASYEDKFNLGRILTNWFKAILIRRKDVIL